MAETKTKKYVLTAASGWTLKSVETKGLLIWIDMVNQMAAKKYPGELEIVYKGGPEAIPPAQQIEAVRQGLVDMVYSTAAYFQGAVTEAAGMKLSRITPLEELDSGYVAFLNNIFEKKVNSIYFGRIGEDVGYYIYLRTPVTKPDFTGLNIRGSSHHVPALKALGASPIQIMGGEIYTALERNVIQGFVWPSTGVTDMGFHTQIKYKIMPGFFQSDMVVLINRDSFHSLPKHLQELLREATILRMKECVAWWKEQEAACHSILLKSGVKVIEFLGPDREYFLKKTYNAGWEDFTALTSVDIAEKTRILLKERIWWK